ncbi:MAG TPA: hypothetical protein VKQ36_08535 [Ktedonobacterales bacterium]|nr:hypothetical protein [Ktedonobacterales bacterium]
MAEHIFDTFDDTFDAYDTPDDVQPDSTGDQREHSEPNEKSSLAPEARHAEDNTDLDEMTKLAREGFTSDEAARLIVMSERMAHSSETRESEAVMRRLRFTRWLVEQGLLSEFPR